MTARLIQTSMIVLASLALLGGCDKEPKPEREPTLRILSWNTFALPTIAGQMGQINMDEEDRGRAVARRLKESPYDVIALNEVFDETIRDALLDEAQSGPQRFRFVVEDLDGGGAEDSGLVLLSRLEPIRFSAPAPQPFQHGGVPSVPTDGTVAPFPGTQAYQDTRNCADMDVWFAGNNVDAWVSGNGDNCLIAFHRYRHCTDEAPETAGDVVDTVIDPFLPLGAECDAGKGVAYVRLKQRNGKALDVFWSHTQANLTSPEYEEPLPDFLSERDGQLAELEAMVAQWSPSVERDAVILGDLNVDGMNTDGEFKQEYRKQLASGDDSRFGKLGFRDLWPEASTKEDQGESWSTRNDHVPAEARDERLDYVLWRDRKGSVGCDQHPKIERHFDHSRADGSSIDLSDHFGVGAEVRRRGDAIDSDTPEPCSPSLARLREKLPNGGEMKGTLATPGACHWLRIEQGTWTVTNMGAHALRLAAFAARDVSEPLDFFRGDAEVQSFRKTEDEAQVAIEEPFLLKICWQDPARTGDYNLLLAPNVGQDSQHPVVLPLNREVKLAYGQQFGANPNNLIWTLVQLPKTFSTDGHALRVELGEHAATPLRTGTAPAGAAESAINWINGFVGDEGLLDVGAHGGPAPDELSVVLEREDPADASALVSFSARVLTDHHEVNLGVLECVEQEDSTGDDRIRMTYSADGKSHDIVDLGAFDEGQDVNLSGHNRFGSNWVRGEVRITIYDQDGEDLEDDVTSGNALDNLGSVTIGDFTGDPAVDAELKDGVKKFTQDEANYRLEFSRRR